MFLSSLDLYFFEKDDSIPVTIQIRNVELGTPTGEIVNDFAQVVLDPTVLDTDNTSIIKTSYGCIIGNQSYFPISNLFGTK